MQGYVVPSAGISSMNEKINKYPFLATCCCSFAVSPAHHDKHSIISHPNLNRFKRARAQRAQLVSSYGSCHVLWIRGGPDCVESSVEPWHMPSCQPERYDTHRGTREILYSKKKFQEALFSLPRIVISLLFQRRGGGGESVAATNPRSCFS